MSEQVEREVMDFCVEFGRREGIEARGIEEEPYDLDRPPNRTVELRIRLGRLSYKKVLPVSLLATYNGELGCVLAYEIGRMRSALRHAALRGGG